MSWPILYVLLLCLVGVSVNGYYLGTEQSPFEKLCPGLSVKCDTNVHVNIDGNGACLASANGYCSAWASNDGDCFNRKTLYTKAACRATKAHEDARCWAQAASAAYTNVYSSVLCSGEYAYGCAKVEAHATAIACALSKSIVDLNVDFGHNKGRCHAQVAKAVTAIAKSVANSKTNGCSRHGVLHVASDFDMGVAVQEALTKAFASCLNYCDKNGRGLAIDRTSTEGGTKGRTTAKGDKGHASVAGDVYHNTPASQSPDPVAIPVSPAPVQQQKREMTDAEETQVLDLYMLTIPSPESSGTVIVYEDADDEAHSSGGTSPASPTPVTPVKDSQEDKTATSTGVREVPAAPTSSSTSPKTSTSYDSNSSGGNQATASATATTTDPNGHVHTSASAPVSSKGGSVTTPLPSPKPLPPTDEDVVITKPKSAEPATSPQSHSVESSPAVSVSEDRSPDGKSYAMATAKSSDPRGAVHTETSTRGNSVKAKAQAQSTPGSYPEPSATYSPIQDKPTDILPSPTEELPVTTDVMMQEEAEQDTYPSPKPETPKKTGSPKMSTSYDSYSENGSKTSEAAAMATTSESGAVYTMASTPPPSKSPSGRATVSRSAALYMTAGTH